MLASALGRRAPRRDFQPEGPCDDPDEYRGILLEENVTKGMKEVLAPFVVFDSYSASMLDSQFGAVGGRGTDMAAFLLQCFMAYCDQRSLSYFVLFVDLVKILDKILREITVGIPGHVADLYQYLRDRGLTHAQAMWAMWVAQWVGRHRSQFLRWGMSLKIVRLLCNLHAVSWVTVGCFDTAPAALKGGHQGCQSEGAERSFIVPECMAEVGFESCKLPTSPPAPHSYPHLRGATYLWRCGLH
ncbi:unnamed protein product [Prorocentrum cordatum]|uniref:Uncharacterized protein n=1 Tax=Prorocentrum cordatum TaxID=2364126 RepID=A0ABN9T0L2_9DINO|nr:unnamed protein product [Polarella glacialis]